jgi:hypothetical protein
VRVDLPSHREPASAEKLRILGLRPLPSTFPLRAAVAYRQQITLDFLSFATGRVTRVMTVDRISGLGLDVSPDGRTLLFAQRDFFTEDLMLVENFR